MLLQMAALMLKTQVRQFLLVRPICNQLQFSGGINFNLFYPTAKKVVSAFNRFLQILGRGQLPGLSPQCASLATPLGGEQVQMSFQQQQQSRTTKLGETKVLP